MTSSTEVTLRTERGWSHKTTLDDPVFSDILAPYLELGESPSEVELTGSVGEVVEEHWHWWLMNRGTNLRLVRQSRTTVLTSSLIHFSTILNLPPEWVMYVVIDEGRIPRADVARHYKAVHDVMSTMGIDPHYDLFTAELVSAMCDALSVYGDASEVLRGASWSVGIEYNSCQCDHAILLFNWPYLFTYLIDQGVEHTSLVGNTVRALMGKGSMTDPGLFHCSTLSRPTRSVYDKLSENSVAWENVTLRYYGLGFLIGDDGGPINGSVLSVLSLVHEQAMDTDYFNRYARLGADVSEFYGRVMELRKVIGDSGLRRMNEFLLVKAEGYMSRSEWRRVKMFQLMIEEAMRDD